MPRHPRRLLEKGSLDVSDPNKSFFSGLHGAITGLAAFVTSIVAVVGLALNQGWIGGHSKSSPATSTAPGSTAAGSSVSTLPGDTTTTGTGLLPGGSNAVPTYAVDPTTLVFPALGPRDATVTVKNTGSTSMTVQPPTMDGPDKARFVAMDLGCAGPIEPGRSCQIKVTFIPATGNFNATLVVQVSGAPQPTDVPIQASAIL